MNLKAPLDLSQSAGRPVSHGTGFFRVEPDGLISEINATLAEWLGLPSNPDCQGTLRYSSILSPDSRVIWEAQMQALLEQGFVAPFALTFISPDGQPLAAKVSLMSFSGSIGCMVQSGVADLPEPKPPQGEGEAQFQILVNGVATQIFDMAPDGTLRYVNRPVLEFFGADRENAIKQGAWAEDIHPEDMEKLRNAITQALQTHTDYTLEVRGKNRQGEYRWLLSTVMPSFYPNGDFYGLVGSNVDITERKEVELALKVSEERFRIIANASPAHIFDMAPDGAFRFLNQAVMDFIPAERQSDIMTGRWSAEVHPDDLENFTRLVQQALAGKREPYQIEFRSKRRDGVYRWFFHMGVPSYYPNGDFYGLIGFTLDISALKEAEFARRESEARWREMANAVPIMLWVSNTLGEAVFINNWWYQYTGLTPEESLGKQWMDVVHPDDRDLAMAVTQQYLMGDPFEIECRYRNALGEYRWHLSRVVPAKDADGRMLNWYGSSLDIHDRRMIEQELGKARDVAEDANKKKSQFLANMSHELRTPLNAVIGFSDMLKKGMAGPMTEKQGGYVEHIATSGRHLLAMVNDILDISMAEAGKIKMSLAYVELAPFLDDLREMVSYSAQKGGVALHFEVQPGLAGLVADADRLRQILLNLIGNAIKFNHEGGRVDVSLSRSEDHQWVIGEIRDTGIGIPADKIDQLFSEFYQVDTSNTRQYEGTGLGLALTKRLVELHHGSIMVESREGVGSTFTFRLPQNPQSLCY